jgi:hypothetical protein
MGQMSRTLNRLLARRGYVIAPARAPEPLEPEFLTAYERCRSHTMASRERLYANWCAARYVAAAGIGGDVVECGVWKGGSAMMLALGLLAAGDRDRTLWLYDTFEGMPEPTAEDVSISGHKDARRQWEEAERETHNEWCYGPLDVVRRNLEATGFPNVRYVKGKVEDTIPAEAPERIAVLRLDTDWYDSTRHELEHLYPRLAPGAPLLIDDYGEWAGSRKAVDEHLARHPAMLHRVDHTGRTLVKPA